MIALKSKKFTKNAKICIEKKDDITPNGIASDCFHLVLMKSVFARALSCIYDLFSRLSCKH